MDITDDQHCEAALYLIPISLIAYFVQFIDKALTSNKNAKFANRALDNKLALRLHSSMMEPSVASGYMNSSSEFTEGWFLSEYTVAENKDMDRRSMSD